MLDWSIQTSCQW